MDEYLRLCYQRQLIYSGLDDFNPSSVFPNYLGGEGGEPGWQKEVVSFLCQGVSIGLIRVVNWENLFSKYEKVDIKAALLDKNFHKKFEMDRSIIWNALYFFATENLIEDLNSFCLRDWGALKIEENKKFLKFIQKKYGVNIY